MALAWISTRDLETVRLLWEEYRVNEMGLPFSGTFDLDLFDIEIPEHQMKEAGRLLLAALRSNKVAAYELSGGGTRQRVDPVQVERRWEIGRKHDNETIIRDAYGPKLGDVVIESVDLIKAFPSRLDGIGTNVVPSSPGVPEEIRSPGVATAPESERSDDCGQHGQAIDRAAAANASRESLEELDQTIRSIVQTTGRRGEKSVWTAYQQGGGPSQYRRVMARLRTLYPEGGSRGRPKRNSEGQNQQEKCDS